jgi:hypothetical protein
VVALAAVAVAPAVAQTPPAASQSITRAGEQPSAAGPADFFTGRVRVDPVWPADGSTGPGSGRGTDAGVPPRPRRVRRLAQQPGQATADDRAMGSGAKNPLGDTALNRQATDLRHSYWPADRSQPVLGQTAGEALRLAALRFADRTALVEVMSEWMPSLTQALGTSRRRTY